MLCSILLLVSNVASSLAAQNLSGQQRSETSSLPKSNEGDRGSAFPARQRDETWCPHMLQLERRKREPEYVAASFSSKPPSSRALVLWPAVMLHSVWLCGQLSPPAPHYGDVAFPSVCSLKERVRGWRVSAEGVSGGCQRRASGDDVVAMDGRGLEPAQQRNSKTAAQMTAHERVLRVPCPSVDAAPRMAYRYQPHPPD
ncbi:hypothetical protein C7974DRAFT_380788 [Boeremia exigua]|uniref:uncharacterized protein n=1 Tax=Boeremia exigua TaxID=749465 RepID=UPI001E8E690E|nr:uncharacterized protein C7974DRAFT_380788 [Boeremia exigua]KAH6613079.1 hypothetical protein C7974DRAFT_380788 [Boeremia exigua]